MDFTIRQTVETDHKPNITTKTGRTKKIIQVEDTLDYWEREKSKPLEKAKENDTVWNKAELREEKRVKKLIYIEDPERIQFMGREREKERKLPSAKIPEKS